MSPSPSVKPRTSRARSAVRAAVTSETTSGALLLAAALVALVWASSPWRAAYATISGTVVGPAALHLDLDLATWAADGLLAVFFFVVGLELKRELVVGTLRDVRHAAVPALAAVGGMVVPAVLYTVVVLVRGDRGALHGWAVPTATDIAFALAVLAVVGRRLPPVVRMFLLTLAVVDDLLAVTVIAVLYTDHLRPGLLGAAVLAVALFALVVRRSRAWYPVAAVVALGAWALMHASGVHATIAGVALGLVVPAHAVRGERTSRAVAFEDAWRPWSAGLALPVFAFFAAGVDVVDGDGLAAVLREPAFAGVLVGLVVGKPVGVVGTTILLTRFTALRLPPGLGLRTLLPAGLLAGIGFTVSLLIAALSFDDPTRTTAAKLAVLVASTTSAALAAVAARSARRPSTPTPPAP